MKELKLTKNQVALVDDDVFDDLSIYTWNVSETGYAYRRTTKGHKQLTILLHREILDAPVGIQVDHINGNKLDNTRVNLRFATNSQNHANKNKPKTELPTSEYKGVSAMKKSGKWRARIKVGYQEIYLGTFSTELEAAIAYNNAAFNYFGDFARLNDV